MSRLIRPTTYIAVCLLAFLLVHYAWAGQGQTPKVALARFYELSLSHSSLGHFRGATESFQGRIVLRRSIKSIGASYVSCIRLSPEVRNCFANYALPQGTIGAVGVIGNPGEYSLSITGGTGAYLGMDGWVTVKTLDGTPRFSEITFHLHKLSGA